MKCILWRALHTKEPTPKCINDVVLYDIGQYHQDTEWGGMRGATYANAFLTVLEEDRVNFCRTVCD